MDTAEIINQCRKLPGVTVKTEKEYAELILSSDTGNGRMKFIPLFEGVTLALIEVHASTWPAPAPANTVSQNTGPLIINYCIRGRCELVLNDNTSVFLTSGQLSLTERFAQNQYIYPGGLYEGIELFIDPSAARNGVAVLNESFGLDTKELSRRYCPNGETFIAEFQLSENLLKRLYGASDITEPSGKIGMKTGVIDLLALLLYRQPVRKEEKLVYYTRFQVEIARQIETVISADLSRSQTVREFSERFSVSESSIKNYFYGVFGQSIPQYRTHKRMEYAARLLKETDLPIIEISGKVGYESQSKFAAAFRRECGASPFEYRRKQKISTAL